MRGRTQSLGKVAGARKGRPIGAAGRRPGEVTWADRWIPIGTAAVGLVAVVLYAIETVRADYHPHSTLGMGIGIAAVVVMVLVMGYSMRRSLTSVRALGRTEPYLQMHLYGGVLFLLLFVIHTDFGIPSGTLDLLLWITTLWVVVTGAIGVVLQRYLPKILDDGSTMEVHLNRIPELVDELRQRAEEAVQRTGSRVRFFYERELAEELEQPRTIFRLAAGRTMAQTFRSHEMDILRQTLDDEGEEVLEELHEIYRAKSDLDLHYTLQPVLRGWLALHLPAGVLLILLVVLHVFFVLYF